MSSPPPPALRPLFTCPPRPAGSPDEQLNPKKKVWEVVQPELSTDEQRPACYRGQPLRTGSGGVCTVRSVAGGTIR